MSVKNNKHEKDKVIADKKNEGNKSLNSTSKPTDGAINTKHLFFKGLVLFFVGIGIGGAGLFFVTNQREKEPVSNEVSGDLQKSEISDKTEVPITEVSEKRTETSEKVLESSSETVEEKSEKAPKKKIEKEQNKKIKKVSHEKEEIGAKQEKLTSDFTSQLPGIIEKRVAGLEGYYSYYLHDLSEEEGVSGSNKQMLSASTIKLFILEAAFSQVKRHELELNAPYELADADKVSGTGSMQEAPEGTRYTNASLLTLMIIDSDNTATNIMIDRLGGLEKISDYILDRGYGETVLARKMSDMGAISQGKENYTSVDDVGRLMSKLARKELVGINEDEKMLEILSNGKNHDKLAKYIPNTMTVYCKSGEFNDFGVQNDTILMEGPGGDYILTIMSEDGDESEQFSVMQSIGEEAYDLISKE